MGKRFLSRVEEVQIIDSLIVDKKNFFTHFKMSPESGKIFDYGTFFGTSDAPEGATVYQTQRGDKIVYTDVREGTVLIYVAVPVCPTTVGANPV